MSRYRGPKLRIIRRLGLLPGLSVKNSNRTNPPGKPGKDTNDEKENNSKKKLTEYGARLEEKQKLKFNYGLTESQLFKYVKEARRRNGITGLILLQLLEMRLDTICFTLGFAKTIAQARQLVSHGYITVNKKVVNIPSFQCRINDIISVKEKNNLKLLIKNHPITEITDHQIANLPNHLEFDKTQFQAIIRDYCNRDNITLELNELFIIEHYSRR